jgi:hypothetical protein
MSTRRSTDQARPTGVASAAQGPKLPRIRRRLHDTIDLASGRIFSTRIARPLTAAERVERLARFDFKANPSIFAKPTHRLTPRAPYQSAPEANTFVFAAPNFQVFSYSTADSPTGQIFEMIGHPRKEIAISMIEERTVDIGLVHNSANLDTRVSGGQG